MILYGFGWCIATVTAVTNSSAFTVASSGGSIANETSGTVRKAYKMGIRSNLVQVKHQ